MRCQEFYPQHLFCRKADWGREGELQPSHWWHEWFQTRGHSGPPTHFVAVPEKARCRAFRALNLNLKIAGQKYGHCYRKFLITIYVPRSSKANKWWWIFLRTWILYFLELHSIWSFLWGVVGGGLKWITLALKWVSYDGMGTKCLWKLTVLEKSYIDPIFSLQDMVTQKNTVSIVFSDF